MHFASLLLSACCAAQGSTDVAIFILDDVGKSDISLYGGPAQTPNLDALATQGVTFTRCYANPMCMPSRMSLMCGVWATETTGEPCDPLGPKTPPLALEFIPEALPGYTTGLVGKWHLGTDPLGGPWQIAPIRQGFGNWIAGHAGNVGQCAGTNYGNWERVNADASFYSSAVVTTYEPAAVRDAFNLGWTHAASPKLAIVSGQLAHAPFHVPPAPFWTGSTPGSERGRYEAMITANDYILGQMLQRIDLATTLVIVVGDNGTPGQVSPNASRAKFTSYERGVSVPLVVAGCGVEATGRLSGELVHLVDLWATAIEAGQGAPPGGSPEPIRSVSLWPILRDEPHWALHDWVLVGHNWDDLGLKGNRAAISGTGIKLIQWDDDGDKLVDREELYDLAADPLEAADLLTDSAYAADLAAARAFILAEAP